MGSEPELARLSSTFDFRVYLLKIHLKGTYTWERGGGQCWQLAPPLLPKLGGWG